MKKDFQKWHKKVYKAKAALCRAAFAIEKILHQLLIICNIVGYSHYKAWKKAINKRD